MSASPDKGPRPTPSERRSNIVPKILIVAGTLGIISSLIHSINTGEDIRREVNREFPPLAEPEKLSQAAKEVEVFDRAAHTLIRQGELTISIPRIADPQRLQHAIDIVEGERQQSARRTARDIELYQQQTAVDFGDSRLSKGEVSTILGLAGTIALSGALFLSGRREPRRNGNQNIQSTNSTA